MAGTRFDSGLVTLGPGRGALTAALTAAALTAAALAAATLAAAIAAQGCSRRNLGSYS